MMLNRRVTIKQVAQAAGVSTQTVSRVLNDRPDVAAETRQRIKHIMIALGYQPSALARSLIQQRSYTLGVVTAGLNYSGPSRTLFGISMQAEQLGYTLILKQLPSFTSLDIEPLINSLLAHQVDGLIWAVPEIGGNHNWLDERLHNMPVPIIFLAMEERPGISIVGMDNFTGGCLATQHLLEQGCRHIGHVSGPLEWWEARQRKAGWERTLADAGQAHSEKQWAEGNWSAASGERAFRLLVDQYPQIDGVFIANDQMAISVVLVASRIGRRIPEDLAVIGFDDIQESAFFRPPLTTVFQDQTEMGRSAVRHLVSYIETSHAAATMMENRNIIFQPQLIVRESSRNFHNCQRDVLQPSGANL
ncbi:MAG TPA: LacI family DNA-binding transcriptional regulator [Levilinea sp.]|nr:LacI family DNA-binding transcriptional regulator [Levilinea sp.]